MRIIFLEAVQNFGGSKRSIIEIASLLKKSGHEILIIDFWGANKEFEEAVRNRGISYKTLSDRKEPFVISKKNRLSYIYNVIRYFYKRVIYKRKFEELVNDFQPERVCVNSLKTLDILSKKSHYKIDYYVRGWTLANNFKTRFFFKKYHLRFIAVSEATRQAISLQHNIPLENISLVKVAVAKKSVNEEVFKENFVFDKRNPIKLLHAGTFVKTKGHHISLLVAKALKDNSVHFNLKIAGLISVNEESFKYYELLKKMVFDLNLTDDVEFIINNHDLSNEINNADVLVNPSYTEGLPRICLESMALGKPVISNAVGGVIEIVINNYSGFLVNFNCIEDYVRSIKKYYESPSLYFQHGLKSMEIVNSSYLSSNLNDNLKLIYHT